MKLLEMERKRNTTRGVSHCWESAEPNADSDRSTIVWEQKGPPEMSPH